MASSKSLKRKRGLGTLDDADRASESSTTRAAKLAKHTAEGDSQLCTDGDGVKHALVAQYFPRTATLRAYVLSKLPAGSRMRRKKIASVGRAPQSSENPLADAERALGRLLDTTLVGFHQQGSISEKDRRWEHWVEFSQKGDESYVTLSEGSGSPMYSQAEIVDFVIWLVFSREPAGRWPKHLLCDGFRRHGKAAAGAQTAGPEIPGLFVAHHNRRVEEIKASPWPQLLVLLGKAGEQIMIDLLLDCSIFLGVESGKDNLYQLSGISMSELKPSTSNPVSRTPARNSLDSKDSGLSPTEITFVRSRMLYARAALNARGLVHFGLRHIHALNRLPCHPAGISENNPALADPHSRANTIRIMMYMFPRQFGLHNVFTSVVDRKQTAQKFQDYTLREDEIKQKFTVMEGDIRVFYPHVPKRLRGATQNLVQRLQVLHARCSYAEMLQHYCPVQEQIQIGNTPRQTAVKASQSKNSKAKKKSKTSADPTPILHFESLVELATPVASISAFCQAVLRKIIPADFWGAGDARERNREVFLKNVDHFLRLRRFESMSLHEAAQGIKITSLEWLMPPNLKDKRCSQTETRKRTEIFHEFLYYLFDSILIPLIRSNFYVTESNVHRYRIFYFRHDVWRYIAEPAMASLKTKMFEEVKLDGAMRILDSRRLGFSQVRLLPKGASMRPITNLRRRTVLRGNKKLLGPSINSILGPLNSVFKLEKGLDPRRLGSAMFSVGDIYTRIKAFRATLGSGNHTLYFAKVDVRAAFDTIPQRAIVELMKRIPGQSRYKIAKHVEIRAAESASAQGKDHKPRSRWHSLAKAAGDTAPFLQLVEEQLGTKRTGTVFIDNIVHKSFDTEALLSLLASHVGQNLVKIGKKYYRQKQGIPQGSVLSSTLCNYFYADLEMRHLSFLQGEDCLLLRLIDDFLLITRTKSKAIRFVRTMHAGLPDYGVAVSEGKSLVNFEMSTSGSPVPRLQHTDQFPYCGTLIDCGSLDVSKDRENPKDPVIFNTLTVEFSRSPGLNFKRKVLNAFKIQSHLMFFDTSHNSRKTALHNIYTAFVETATKTWAYARCLPKDMKPTDSLLIASIQELVAVSFRVLSSKARKMRYPGYKFGIHVSQVTWLAMVAFRQVLARKQAVYAPTIGWLEDEIKKLSCRKEVSCQTLVKTAMRSASYKL